MKQMLLGALLTCSMLGFVGCEKGPSTDVEIKKSTAMVNGHQLSVYQYDGGTEYVAVFESGLGDGVLPWREKMVMEQTASRMSVIGYDRAGYLESESATGARDIPALRSDLERLLEIQFPGKKYLLISHSLGGLTIRDYALHHPEQTAGMLFIDPTHEAYNNPDQAFEDFLVCAFGPNSGPGQEARQLMEDIAYAKSMAALPDKPCTVITSIQTSPENDLADRQKWYNAHENLGKDLSDFTHLKTATAGHYIHKEAPDLVIQALDVLLNKMH